MEKTIVMGDPGRVPVDTASVILKRLYYIERELMRTLGGFLINVENWELKKLLPLHVWQDSKRANELRGRVLEMRFPRRDVDQNHHEQLTEYLQTLIRSHNDEELIQGVYWVTKTFLMEVYEDYLHNADPLDDAPTVAFMERFPAQLRKQISQIKDLYKAEFKADESPIMAWQKELYDYLYALKDLFLADPEKAAGVATNVLPFAANRQEYIPPIVPVREPHFTEGAVYYLPPIYGQVDDFLTNQVLQGIVHVNEIWAAEITGLMLWLWSDMPWEFYMDTSRWCYDESRHCQMGEQRLKTLGFQTGVDFPVFPDQITSQESFLDAFILLHALEINGPAWKRGLKQEFEEKGDTASSQDFDYDWADESIHLLYGYKWALHRLGGDEEKLEEAKERTRDRYHQNYEALTKLWDYQPFLDRILNKIAGIKNKLVKENDHVYLQN